MGTTPASWLGNDNYHVIPPVLEPDALPLMFGGFPDDVDPRIASKPKRNAAVPGRFLSQIYAVPNVVMMSHIVCSQQHSYDCNDVMCLCFVSEMKKTGYICFPWWKEDGRDRPYSRSYDLFAHMVNVHEKFPVGASNKTAYKTDGSDVRDATPEEMIRYRDANEHRCKKVDEKSSSSEPSQGSTMLPAEVLPKARPVSARPGQSGGDSPPRNKTGMNRASERERDSSPKSDDRGSSTRHKSREPEQRERATETVGDVDEEEADGKHMAEIQGRIEARKAAKDLEIARLTIIDLKESDRDKAEGKKKVATSRFGKKPSATQPAAEATSGQSVASIELMPTELFSEVVAIMGTSAAVISKRVCFTKCATAECRPDDAMSTLKFGALDEVRQCGTEQIEDVLGAELGIAFVASALGREMPRSSSEHATADMPDCYVELTSTRRKAKAPVAVVPLNSIDSKVDRDDTGSEIPDVHIEIPGEVRESIASEVEAGREAPIVVGQELTEWVLRSPRVEVATMIAEIATANRALVASTPNTDGIASFCEAMLSVESTGGKTIRL